MKLFLLLVLKQLLTSVNKYIFNHLQYLSNFNPNFSSQTLDIASNHLILFDFDKSNTIE